MAEARAKTSIHKKKQALEADSAKFEAAVKAKGEDDRRLEANQKLLQFLCATGTAIHVVSSPQFTAFVESLNPRVQLYSESSLGSAYIPAEAT